MTTTFQVQPYEAESFLNIFRKAFGTKKVKVTVEPVGETQEETNARFLEALAAEKRGDFVHTMTVDELEAMVQ
jgi:hypothetical protein